MICLWGKKGKVKADYLPDRLRMKVGMHDLLVEKREKVAVAAVEISHACRAEMESCCCECGQRLNFEN